jgi:hypothetical protein
MPYPMMCRLLLAVLLAGALGGCQRDDDAAAGQRTTASPATGPAAAPPPPVPVPALPGDVAPDVAPADAHGEEDAMQCDAGRAQWMIGEQPTEELLARGAADAGAQVSRYIRHDEMVTMEYHPSRLNVDLGEDGLIRAVRCG